MEATKIEIDENVLKQYLETANQLGAIGKKITHIAVIAPNEISFNLQNYPPEEKFYLKSSLQAYLAMDSAPMLWRSPKTCY